MEAIPAPIVADEQGLSTAAAAAWDGWADPRPRAAASAPHAVGARRHEVSETLRPDGTPSEGQVVEPEWRPVTSHASLTASSTHSEVLALREAYSRRTHDLEHAPRSGAAGSVFAAVFVGASAGVVGGVSPVSAGDAGAVDGASASDGIPGVRSGPGQPTAMPPGGLTTIPTSIRNNNWNSARRNARSQLALLNAPSARSPRSVAIPNRHFVPDGILRF